MVPRLVRGGVYQAGIDICSGRQPEALVGSGYRPLALNRGVLYQISECFFEHHIGETPSARGEESSYQRFIEMRASALFHHHNITGRLPVDVWVAAGVFRYCRLKRFLRRHLLMNEHDGSKKDHSCLFVASVFILSTSLEESFPSDRLLSLSTIHLGLPFFGALGGNVLHQTKTPPIFLCFFTGR
jgi:hypothetical protein